MRVRKKVLVCTLFTILISSLIIGGLYLYSQDNKTPTLKDNSLKITNTNVEEKNEEQKQENIIEETNKKDDVVTSDTTNQNVVKEENKSSSSNNSSTPIIDNSNNTNKNSNDNKVENKKDNDSKVEENKENVSNEDTNNNQNNTSENKTDSKEETNNTEVEEPVSTPTVDDEYNSLLEYVDYTAEEYSICYSDSIDVALTDTVNIRNTSCKQFAYNGNIVGYKIQIFYRDGTVKFYDKNS